MLILFIYLFGIDEDEKEEGDSSSISSGKLASGSFVVLEAVAIITTF